jgi:HlyD family secretion protein
MRRFVRIGIVVIVLAAVLFWAFRPAPVSADFAAVERGSLQVTVAEEGHTRVRDRYVISAPVPGRMRRIELEPGDPVVAGKTVLARFEPTDPALLDVRTRTELEARVRAAESAAGAARADRDRIKAELAFAQSELKRTRELVKGGALAQRELELAERQVRTLEQSLESAVFTAATAQHQLEIARAGLVQTRSGRMNAIPLYSPVNGVVLRRLQESETVVPTGQPLIEVGDLRNLEIVADLLSSEAVKVETGQPVIIEQWGGDRPLKGRVRRVEPSGFTKISALGVEEQRVNVIVDLEDRPKDLGDGYRVEIRVIIWSRDNVLKIPTSSLFRSGSDWAVYKVAAEEAVRRIVTVGQRNDLEAEVLSGLSEGDRIVVYPSDAIQEGVALTPRS